MNDRSYDADVFGGGWSRRLAGAGLGVIATGSGLAVAELLVGMIRGSSSPVIAVGQKVIDLVPLPLKNWAVETFGTSDKVVLVVTTLFLVFLAGIAVGGLAVEGRQVAAIVGVGLIAVVGVSAVLTRPDPSVGRVVPILVGGAVSLAVMMWLTPRLPVRTAQLAPSDAVATLADTGAESPLEYTPMVIPGIGTAGRRQFLARSVGVAAVAAITGGTGRLLQRRFRIGSERAALALPPVPAGPLALPPNADLEVPGLSPFVTPNATFYRIDTALTVPQVSTDDWRLRIHGMVDNEIELTFDDLLGRDQIEAYVTLACVSNPTGGPYVGNALWQGVRIADLLAEAGVDPASTQLLSTSVDGWTCGTPVSSLNDGRNAILAIAMNGEPLPAEHGYPVRMVVPGEFGYVSATKWVTDWEFTTWEDAEAYWVPRGWSQQAPMKTMTRIETPDFNETVAAGTISIAGSAWAVHRGVSVVEVRIDEGEWMRAELGGVPSPDTWRKWVVEWKGEPGEYVVEARTTDGTGAVETDELADVAPNGASGYDRITIKVE
ncbi:MAG: molybdopterin-dependent oxidoreductase [Actinomycetota bacterium]|nr:molybdopterin-dependent oxidoreductase [Actinomycetota bacterium]